MKQNKYDDPDFFPDYNQILRSTGGLNAAGVWQILSGLLPELKDKILDLDCGFGWHCQYASPQQAQHINGH